MKSAGINNFDFDQLLTEMVHDIPPDMKHSIHEYIKDIDPFSLANFRITLVIDTNILFPAVLDKALSGKITFIEKLAENPSLRICAPPQLEIEMIDKIRTKFPKDKKGKNVKIEDALEATREILNKIEIIEETDAESIKKAKAVLSHRDPDDIPFLALSLSLGAHGILSDDKDIIENGSVQTWKTAEAGEVVTVLNKGTLCFAIASTTMGGIALIAKEISLVIWAAMVSLAINVWGWIKNGAIFVKEHPFISALIAAGLIIFNKTTGCISAITDKCLEIFKVIGEVLWHMIQVFGDITGESIAGLSVLMNYYDQACGQMAMLKEQ